MAYRPSIRLFVDQALSPGLRLALGREQSHYLCTVMRQRTGQSVRLFNGRDGEWQAELVAQDRRAVTLQLGAPTRAQAPEADIWLLYAPIKRARADFIAQKATELGASRLLPVITERTIASRINTERLYANAVEAAEQSERLTVPDIEALQPLAKALANWPADRRLIFCDETPGGAPIAQAARAAKPGPAAILIGPEGGFTDAERAAITSLAAALPVSLGPRILRADTAALAALAIWQAVCAAPGGV